MKLILENWRRYLKEDEDDYDEEPELTPAQKIAWMVASGGNNNALQARELVRSGTVTVEDAIDELLIRYAKAHADLDRFESTGDRSHVKYDDQYDILDDAIENSRQGIMRFVVGGQGYGSAEVDPEAPGLHDVFALPGADPPDHARAGSIWVQVLYSVDEFSEKMGGISWHDVEGSRNKLMYFWNKSIEFEEQL